MKFRDSGMPDEKMWKTFFNPAEIINKMEINNTVNILVDIGCGYGTFLIPASEVVNEKAVGIDIEPGMIENCRTKINELKIKNIELKAIDIINCDISTIHDLPVKKADYVCLFNILHCENPVKLLKIAFDILEDTGKIGVIHWKYEKTPRGPSMDIRSKPENIIDWAKEINLTFAKLIDLPPYHYGIIFSKTKSGGVPMP
jgi:SAM-dependent methyltransferase